MKKKGFTLVELLAVIVILAVIILIAVTAVIPRMNKAKKKALVDEALMYFNAAKESYLFGDNVNGSSLCIDITDLHGEYINKSNDDYRGVIKSTYVNGELSAVINLTNGNLYLVGSTDVDIDDVTDEMPQGFATTCGDYNPVIADGADTNTLAYKLLMSEGGDSLDANLELINERSESVDYTVAVKTAANSGMFKSEDNDGASFYYRGVVDNNWVSFGGFYWRIIRINGDGSIRMIYSGTSDSNHTGNNALILTSENARTSRYTENFSYNMQIEDVTGLTNNIINVPYSTGIYAHTFAGYMNNPETTFRKFPTKDVTNSSSNKLNKFPQWTTITAGREYYFFNSFDPENDCVPGTANKEGSCLLKCAELGVDCIKGVYSDMSQDANYYDSSAVGSTTTIYGYTSPYKYTCWASGEHVERQNSDGTTSIYISCPIVSEILGVLTDSQIKAVVRYQGLFASNISVSKINNNDSLVKKEVELWYQNNIINHNDGNTSSPSQLEDYLADEVFCVDRTSVATYPGGMTTHYYYGAFTRNYTNKTPSLKCSDLGVDGYTMSAGTQSAVSPKGIGNEALKYPVGLITLDEVAMAGGKYDTANNAYYLYIGKDYWTMSPWHYSVATARAFISTVYDSGKMTYSNTAGTTNHAYGIRPVINLKASVLYDTGSGTEANPYKVKLSA